MSQTSRFLALLELAWSQEKFVCVGLDPVWERLPSCLKETNSPDQLTVEEALISFCIQIVDETHDVVAAFKPNSAFFEQYGEAGARALKKVIAHIKQVAPRVCVILDAKRADIGSTNSGYVSSAFDELHADAITLHPYLGEEALAPFLTRVDTGCIILCRTSNPGAGEFQDLVCDGQPLYLHVAKAVAQKWNTHNNCALVVGATYPAEIAQVRAVVGDLPVLIPGIGAQGGDLAASVKAARDSRGQGFLISSSREVIYASSGPDFAQASRKTVLDLTKEITQKGNT